MAGFDHATVYIDDREFAENSHFLYQPPFRPERSLI